MRCTILSVINMTWPMGDTSGLFSSDASAWEELIQAHLEVNKIEEEKAPLKTFEITADMLASCTFYVEAKTEQEAMRRFKDEDYEPVRRKKTKWVTSPVMTQIKEVK